MNKIAILLCTYNGGKYLGDQLESYTTQTIRDWQLWVSDDGSKDNTLDVLMEYQKKVGASKINIIHGQGLGLGHNFLSLALNREINAEYYAFSDQDDIWNPDKLERAIYHLGLVPQHTPAMYFSRHLVMSGDGYIKRVSQHFERPPTFRNALVQSIASGNTIVLNQAARSLLIEAGIKDAPYHDWWCYLLVTGAGGEVIYDPEPTLRYRQHANNSVGTNTSLEGKLKRMKLLMRGGFKENVIKNIRCLNQSKKILTPKSEEILGLFEGACASPFLKSLSSFLRSGVYRQSRLETSIIALALALSRTRRF